MSDSLHVDTDQAQALVNELAALADSAQQDLTQLKDTLQRKGAAWGNDEPGRIIGDTYEPEAKKGLTGFQNLVDNLRGLSDGIANATKTFNNQDQENARQVSAAGHNNGSGSAGLPSTSPPLQQPIAQTGSAPQSALSPNGSQSNTNDNTASAGSSDSPVESGQSGYQPDGNPYVSEQPGSAGADLVDGSQTPYGGQMDPGATAPGATPQAVAGATPQPVADGAPQAGRGTAAPATAAPVAAAPAPAGAHPATNDATGTPWSSRQAATPVPRNVAGTPWSAPGSGPPGQAIAPRRNDARPGAAKPTPPHRNSKSRKPKRVSVEPASIQVDTDSAALEAARALAARHGLRVVGFDTSGVAETTVHEIAAALDHILGKYPFLELGGIEIIELGAGEISRVTWDRPVRETEGAKTTAWILLDRNTVANPAELTDKFSAPQRSGKPIPGSGARPLYSAVVADLGRILEAGAGRRPRRLAQRSLITEYRRISGPWAGAETLARVVGGYRGWRAQLGGRSIIGGRFHTREALVAAFTEVELRGGQACGPAKALHRLVVECARERSSIR